MTDFNNQDYFDFSTEEESPEQHSKHMRSCPHCGNPVPADSLFCLYCGEPLSPARKNKWLAWIVFLILAALLSWIFIPCFVR